MPKRQCPSADWLSCVIRLTIRRPYGSVVSWVGSAADSRYPPRSTTKVGIAIISIRLGSTAGDPTGGLTFAIFGPDSTAVFALDPVPPDPENRSKLGFDTFAALCAAIT